MALTENPATLNALKHSFCNILAYVVKEEQCNAKLDCLKKWAIQLGLHQLELHRLMSSPTLTYQAPQNNIDALEQVYDLVYMVYMDGMIEDIELELVSSYAKGVGLEPFVVNNLLKALITAQLDGVSDEATAIRSDIKVHPEVYV